MARHKRRKPGSGYTTQAPNKTWSAFFPKRGSGYHVRKGFSTRALAEAWLDSLLKQRVEKVDVAKGQTQTGEWIDKWIERSARERGWKAKMLADVLYKLGYVKPYVGDHVLADVLPDHIDTMLDELARDLAENTIRQIRNYLFQVFESAVKRRYITFNPVIKPERRKKARQKEPERLSAAMAAMLLHAADETFYGLAWWLIVCCGLRAGEVCGLRRSDIDLNLAALHIDQEYTDLRGRPHRDLPKGDKQRVVPFPRALAVLITAHFTVLTQRAARGMRAGTWQEHQLVFPGRSGRPMNPTSLRHMLKRLTDHAALPPIVTHNLRHTCSGLLHTLGAPQDIIGGLLGHGPRTITGHYAPPDIETMRPWVEQAYRLLAGEVEKAKAKQEA